MSKCYLIFDAGEGGTAIELTSGTAIFIWDAGDGSGRMVTVQFDDPEELWDWAVRLDQIVRSSRGRPH